MIAIALLSKQTPIIRKRKCYLNRELHSLSSLESLQSRSAPQEAFYKDEREIIKIYQCEGRDSAQQGSGA